ncbi:MAG TPA: hypothetical protein VI564_05640, partial [Candidatus Nanoarchaeia archaeon]|nr:hypothetical protein [Candidatus Nanoarchaeia archaeon]
MAHKHPNKYSLLIPLIGVAVILFMFVVSVGSGALHNSDNRVTGRATQNSAGISVTLSGPSSVSDDFEVVAIARNIPSSVTGAVLRIYESDNLGNREKFIKDCKLGTANSVSANSVESVTQGECKAVIPTANWRNGDKHYYFAVLKHSSIVPNPTSALLTVTKSLGTYSIEFEEQTSGEVSGEFTFTAAADKPSDGKIRMEVDGVLINKCVESCVSKCKCSATVPAGTVDKWPSQSKHVISAILTDKQDGKLSRTDKTVTKSAFAQEIEITEPGDTVSAKFEITGKVPRIESDSKLKIILDETPVKRCLNGQNVCNVEVSDRVVNLWQTGSEHKITVVLLDQNEKEKLRKEKKITKKSPGTFQLVISSPTANEVSAGFDLKASVSPANVPSDSKLKLYRKNGGGQEELLNKCTGAADCLYTFSDDAVNRWTAGTQVVLGALLLDRQDGELARIEKTVTKQAYASELQLDVPNEPVFNAFDAVATATNKPSDSRLKFFLDDELPIKVCAKSENPCRATVNEQKVNSWQPGSGHIVHASLRDPQDKLISSTQKPVSRLKVDVSLAVPQEPVTGDFAVTATAGANFPQNSRLKIKVDNGAYVYLCEPNENPCTKTVLVGSHSTYKIVAVAKSESSVDL